MSEGKDETEKLGQENEALRCQITAFESDARRFEATLCTIGEAVISVDAQGHVLQMNRRAEALTGWFEAETKGLQIAQVFKIVNEETRLEAESPVVRVLRDGAVVGLTNHSLLIAKDGVEYPIAHSGTPIRNETGEIISMVLVFRDLTQECAAQRVLQDITERKPVENPLKASEMRYRRLFESAKDGILILDGNTGQIVDVNPFLMELTGYSHEDFLGKHLWEIGPFKDIAASKASFTELHAQDYVRYEDLPLEARDGRKIDVEFISNIYRVDNQNVIQCNIRDITARKLAEKRAEAERQHLEEQLRASQRMEAIGSLAGGVAHDFNNLLSVILNYTEYAMEDEQLSRQLKDDLLEVKKAAERAAILTRQLLAFSRKQVLQPVPLDLNQIAVGIEKMLRRVLGEDIDYVQVLAPDLGLTLADPGQIEQVLMNLVVNARDAMPEGGKLTIETSNVDIDEAYAVRHVAAKPGHYVRLAVADTGCGMDQQTKARLYEPFFTTKEQGKGTGLGLSTVYGIVKQSGDNIWVDSEIGVGSTFKVYLPRELAATKAVVIKPATIPGRSARTETILVVEDEEALRKVVKRSLDAIGYTVLTAANGDEAVLTSARHVGDISLLLTDVVMPRMSGSALFRELSKTRPTLKVLYMSGCTDDSIVHHGVLDAAIQFLSKPFTAADLTRKVQETLDAGITNLPDDNTVQAIKPASEIQEQHLDQDALRTIPKDLLDKLRNAVMATRYDEIVDIIETIRITDHDVAVELSRMADLYDYVRMRDLLRE